MEEIKFRVWDKKYNKMSSFEFMQSRNVFALADGLLPEQFIILPKHENVVLMQYTGLKDKKSKDIYEGDIIRYDEDESINHWVAGEVAQILSLPGRFTARISPFEKFNGSNQNMLNEEFQDSVTIIGNIYENPELLSVSHSK